uniref:Peptidase_M14 domain-containing protein n=1 Tax=Panagrellus redivivus TaxID=6233 RepID=A0A7E4VET2_PANRE
MKAYVVVLFGVVLLCGDVISQSVFPGFQFGYSEKFRATQCSVNQRQDEELNHYLTPEKLNEYLDNVSKFVVSTNVKVTTYGKSHLNRDLKVVKVSHPSNSVKEKPVIIIEAGAHAREWVSPAAALAILRNLTANGPSYLLLTYDVYIVPLINPDGYAYSRTVDKMWRKNRRNNGYRGVCDGVDLNRNYPYKWGQRGAVRDPCSESYQGPAPLSEPEVRNFVEYVEKPLAHRTVAYLSIHSHGRYIVVPEAALCCTPEKKAEVVRVAEVMKAAIKKDEFKITVGDGEWLYPVTGASDDYAASLGIKYVYTMELLGAGYKFALPEHCIYDATTEAVEAFHAMANAIGSSERNLRQNVGRMLRREVWLVLALAVMVSAGRPERSYLTEVVSQVGPSYVDIINFCFTLESIVEYDPRPLEMHVGNYGFSANGTGLFYVHLKKHTPTPQKPIIFIESGSHGDFALVNISTDPSKFNHSPVPFAALSILTELIDGSLAWILDNYNVYLIPVMNPDGYEYARTEDRMWHKNRRQSLESPCAGVDLDRNFPYNRTGHDFTDFFPCDDFYRGPESASEPEVSSLLKLIGSLPDEIKLYLSLHATMNNIIWVPVNAKERPNFEKVVQVGETVARKMANAVSSFKFDKEATKLGSSVQWSTAKMVPIVCNCVQLRADRGGTAGSGRVCGKYKSNF